MFVALAVGVAIALVFSNVSILYPLFWLIAALLLSGDVLDGYKYITKPVIEGWSNFLFWSLTWGIRFFRRWLLFFA